MKFGVQFKEYREDYLQIKQNVAAFELNIDPASLSNYERGDRDFSTGMAASRQGDVCYTR